MRIAVALALAVALGACASETADVPAAVAPSTSTTRAPSTSTTTNTNNSTTTTTTAPPALLQYVFLSEGATNAAGVWALEARLDELGYWPGAVDAVFDGQTSHAVTALQKVAGIERSGRVDLATEWALQAGLLPPVRTATGHVVEIDLELQVMTIATDGRIDQVLDVSTGKRATRTPRGSYGIGRQIDGYRRSRLGLLYRPKYFVGGFAIHGYPSVPTYPASHGCVRVTYPAMDHLWSSNLVPVGTPVVVI